MKNVELFLNSRISGTAEAAAQSIPKLGIHGNPLGIHGDWPPTG
jgi:hypothetical protein